VLELKKLHNLLVLTITQTKALTQIVGRGGIRWEPEFHVDKGWVDIYVPVQKNVERPYVIEVETGYDFNCSEILRKFERFRKALPLAQKIDSVSKGDGLIIAPLPILPKLCVVIPKDFREFAPLLKVHITCFGLGSVCPG